jgi:hypothetical protein
MPRILNKPGAPRIDHSGAIRHTTSARASGGDYETVRRELLAAGVTVISVDTLRLHYGVRPPKRKR